MAALSQVSRPLAGLLKETGVDPANMASIAVLKLSKVLKWCLSEVESDITQPELLGVSREECFQGNAVLQSMETLLFLLPQVNNGEKLKEIADKVVCDVVTPYLTLIGTLNLSQSALAAHIRAISSVVSIFVENNVVLTDCGMKILEIFAKRLDTCLHSQHTCDDLENLTPELKSTSSNSDLLVLVCVLRTAGSSKIEKKGVSLSFVFNSVLQFLQHADLQMCYQLSSSLLPLLVTESHPERVNKIWEFLVRVWNQDLQVNCQISNLVLTVLCCLSSAFIAYDHTFPFSDHLPRFLSDMKTPICDLRKEPIFWTVVQDGLVNSDPLLRKRCRYLLHCVLASVKGVASSGDEGVVREGMAGEGGRGEVISEGSVFWWSGEHEKELSAVWEDLLLILETMEEKQIHIVKPVKKHLAGVISATTRTINDHSLLHMSWLAVAFSRIFDHTEAKTIICWGVQECLTMPLQGSPLLLPDNWKFVFGQLLKVLNLSVVYNWEHYGQFSEPPPIARSLNSFVENFVKYLPQDLKGHFLTEFLCAVDNMNCVEVPLVFLSYALSQLPAAPLLGATALAHIRSVILNGILTHKPSLRAATQCFLLSAVTTLTDPSLVSLEDVIQTLGTFRDSECFIIGTKSWNQASTFLAKVCRLKLPAEVGVLGYFEQCIRSCLKGEGQQPGSSHPPHGPLCGVVPSLLSPASLSRAIVLLAHRESLFSQEEGSLRVLSSVSIPLKEVLIRLLGPVFELVGGASGRPYLSPDAVLSALKIIKTTFRLILREQPEKQNDCHHSPLCTLLLEAATSGHLADAMSYIAQQILKGSKVFGVPDLEAVKFHLDCLDEVYRFLARCGCSSGYRGVTSFVAMAMGVLQDALTDPKAVELTTSFVGAVTLLQWACAQIRLLPSALRSSVLETFPFHKIARFPMKVVLVREKSPPIREDDSTTTINAVVMVTTQEAEKHNFGSLVSHCYSVYWSCLSFYLDFTHDQSEPPGRPEKEKGAEQERMECGEVLVGSHDVGGVVEKWLENLDVASGDGVGGIVESLSSLLPRLVAESGSYMVVSCATTMWPLILEQKNHQRPFFKALRAYAGFVFHRTLLLDPTPNQAVLDMQKKCADNFLELGESKVKVYNILVAHILEVWEELVGVASSAEVLYGSLRTHCGMIVQMATFGPLYKKNLRMVEEVELFLELQQDKSFRNPKFTRYLEDNAGVRVQVTVFLLRLMKTSSSDSAAFSLCQDFFHHLVHHFLEEVETLTKTRKQYYINSFTHRTKLRLLQTLLLITPCVSQRTCEEICNSLCLGLRSDNQLSVRYYMEWILVKTLSAHPILLEKHFYHLLDQNVEMRLSRMCSVFTIALHVGCAIKSHEEKVSYYSRVLPAVLQWSTCHQSMARIYAQATLVRMWEESSKHNLTSVVTSLKFMEPLVQFLHTHGDCAKFYARIEKNAFFSKVDASQDVDLETVFYTLPLLCDVTFEEVIPLKCFRVAVGVVSGDHAPTTAEKEEEIVGVRLSCVNPDLMSGMEAYWASPPREEDGSDTRSLAYHLRSFADTADPSTSVSNVAQQNTSAGDVQKKISLLSNPSAIVGELFPHTTTAPDPLGGFQGGSLEGIGGGGGDFQGAGRSKSKLVLVASLVSKTPNLGGLCRTCEIFAVESLVLSNLKVVEEQQFQSLSVTSEKWLPLMEVKLNYLREYLLTMRRRGYALIGLEQTMRSQCASSYRFKPQTVLVLGNEREGIPVELINLLDDCVEIPQYGTIRSLNVHVSASLLVWEYTKQHLAS